MFLKTILFLTISFSHTFLLAHMNDRADGHAPIGVMGDHTHKKGEFMLSYRLMYMGMDGLRQGTQQLSAQEGLNSTSFMMAPEKMEMWMHMLGAMYAFTDRLTLMAMLPHHSKSMTMQRRMPPQAMESEVEGLGDISVTALFSLFENESFRWIANLGVLLPTGSTNQSMNGRRLGYPMQLGSGSFGVAPSMVAAYYLSSFSLGTRLGFKSYLEDNTQNYRLGNQYEVSLWASWLLNSSLSASLRLQHQIVDPIQGSDPQINGMMSPTNRADFQNGQRSDAFVGLNYLGTDFLKGHRFAIELGTPFYQYLHGLQMNQDFTGIFGYQKTF